MSPDFQEVSLQVYDQDLLKADDPIGKVTFSRKQVESSTSGLSLQHVGDCPGVDAWHPLVKMVKETDVTGEVLIILLLSETETGLDQLTVTVVKGRDIKVWFTARSLLLSVWMQYGL